MVPDNASPIVYDILRKERPLKASDYDDTVEDAIESSEIFDLIRDITDPEHPLTLEQLHVVQEDHIYITELFPHVPIITVEFTPTIPHCSMATLIGLCIRIKLQRSLPFYTKIDIKIKSGTHQSEFEINKQLNDKERVAAAMENTHLLSMVNQCLKSCIF